MPGKSRSLSRLAKLPRWWHLIVLPLVVGVTTTYLLTSDYVAEVDLLRPPQPAGRFSRALVQAENAGSEVERGELIKIVVRGEDARSALQAMESLVRSLRTAAGDDADVFMKRSLLEADAFSRLAGKADCSTSQLSADFIGSATARMDAARKNADDMLTWSMDLTTANISVTDRALETQRSVVAVMLSLLVSGLLLMRPRWKTGRASVT